MSGMRSLSSSESQASPRPSVSESPWPGLETGAQYPQFGPDLRGSEVSHRHKVGRYGVRHSLAEIEHVGAGGGAQQEGMVLGDCLHATVVEVETVVEPREARPALDPVDEDIDRELLPAEDRPARLHSS